MTTALCFAVLAIVSSLCIKGLPALADDHNTHTPFQEIKHTKGKGERIVFVLDMTYSLRLPGRLELLKSLFRHLIRHVINDGDRVAIVRIAFECAVLQGPTRVEGDARRTQLIGLLNRRQLSPGSPSGCGLRLGHEILEADVPSATGGTIFYLSGGKAFRKPSIADELPNLVAKGVVVHSFSLNPEADEESKKVALQTGGKFYSFADVQKKMSL